MPQSPIILSSPYGSERLVRLAARLRPALCDTLITVESQEFPAHSLVLAGVSQQLGRKGHWALVKGISPSTFAQVLHFAYGESVELQPGELEPLEAAAKVLEVQSLEEVCRRARRDRAREEMGSRTKENQEPDKLMWNSESELGVLEEKRRLMKFVGVGGGQQQKHRPAGRSPELARAMQAGEGEQMTVVKPSHSSLDHQEADGKPEVLTRRENAGSKESLGEFPGPCPPPSSLQTSSIPRPCGAGAPWRGEGQPALWSILPLPPRCGNPFSHSTPITGAWQVWPWDQR